jgi:hypothetical protein
MAISAVVSFSVTPVTGTPTVTVQFAVIMLPSCVVADMTAVPKAIAVTKPLGSTEATVGLLLCHVNVLLVALAGSTVGVSVSVLSTASSAVVWLSDTLFTATTFPPSLVLVLLSFSFSLQAATAASAAHSAIVLKVVLIVVKNLVNK